MANRADARARDIRVVAGSRSLIARRAPFVVTRTDPRGAVGIIDGATDQSPGAKSRERVPPAIGMTAVAPAMVAITAVAVIPALAVIPATILNLVDIGGDLPCRRRRLNLSDNLHHD